MQTQLTTITKAAFIKIAKQGLNYHGSTFIDKGELPDTLNNIATNIDNIPLKADSSRVLTNGHLPNLKFKTDKGSHSYLDISGSNCTIETFKSDKYTVYLVLNFDTDNNDRLSIVVYTTAKQITTPVYTSPKWSQIDHDSKLSQLKALDESIEKWRGIVAGVAYYTGNQCPLCDYNNEYDNGCESCIITHITGKTLCLNTPYYATNYYRPYPSYTGLQQNNHMLSCLYDIRRRYIAEAYNVKGTNQND